MTDADGVVVDSAVVAWQAAGDILGLFGVHSSIATRENYLTTFGRQQQEALVGATGAAYLRDLHRLLMRSRAATLRVFPEVIEVFAEVVEPAWIVTSAFADGIVTALANQRAVFGEVLGREKGRKVDLLGALQADGRHIVYVTDSPRDVRLCAELSARSISVNWGYHPSEHLAAASPTFHVETPGDLRTVLKTLGCIRT